MSLEQVLISAKQQAFKDCGDDVFYQHTSNDFFNNLNKVLDKFKEEQSVTDLQNLFEPDGEAVLMLFKRYELEEKDTDLDYFVMKNSRSIFALKNEFKTHQ